VRGDVSPACLVCPLPHALNYIGGNRFSSGLAIDDDVRVGFVRRQVVPVIGHDYIFAA
jgi:hypothetical protein